MLCLSFYEWRCIYPGEQMILAPFLEKTSLDRAPGRFADYLFVPKHPRADVLLTTVLGPLRCEPERPAADDPLRPSWVRGKDTRPRSTANNDPPGGPILTRTRVA